MLLNVVTPAIRCANIETLLDQLVPIGVAGPEKSPLALDKF